MAQQRYRNRQRFRLRESEQKVAELTERVRVLTSDKVRHLNRLQLQHMLKTTMEPVDETCRK